MKGLNCRGCVAVWIIMILCVGCSASDGEVSVFSAAASAGIEIAPLQGATCMYGDVDGDGEIECLYSLPPEETSQGTWQVHVRDGTGRVLKGVIEEARLLRLTDLDADGIPELLLERLQGRQASSSSPTPCPCAKPGDAFIAQLAVGSTGSDGRLVTGYSFLTGDERPLDTFDARSPRQGGDD